MPNIPERSLEELIDLGESDQVEFKETLEYDIWTEKKSPNLVETVLKTIAAFHNSEGGSLLIGVADDGTIMGIDRDLSLLSKGKQSRDGFTLKVQNKIRDQLTPRKERRVRVRFENCSGKDVCIIDVCRLPFITYFNDVLFVRDGPETLQLRGEAMERYLKERNAFDGD
jgi:predicted HTH transcriptional regulator